ncbi:MAG: hypothetical protein V3V99_06690 [candidate division Zixibacteria bacterium]
MSPDKQNIKLSTPVWKQLLSIRRTAPIVFYTMMIYMAAELITVFILPQIIPDHYYLRLYLHEHAIERTEIFLNNEDPFNQSDELLGWQNRPNSQHDNWKVDKYGARTTFTVSKQPTRPIRILFLGSSLINGGPQISVENSISALIEDSVTEAVNFGVMRYSLDQSYLAYREELYEFQPRVLVVELPREPTGGLINQYIPFRHPEAHGMPFLKPRFEINSGRLNLIPLPPRHMFDSLLDNSELLCWLEVHDGYFGKFEEFKKFGILPISRLFWHGYEMIEKKIHFSRGNEEGAALLKKIMTALVEDAAAKNTHIIFLSYPHQADTYIPRWRSLFPDYYGLRIEELSAPGFEIIDCREILRRSGRPAYELYQADMRHMTPIANKLIAVKLKEKISDILSE